MTTYLVSKQGSDNNGGTSRTIRSSGSDGSVNVAAGTDKISSRSSGWTAADIGHAVNVAGKTRLITAVATQTSFTVTTVNSSTTIQSAGLFTAAMVGMILDAPGISATTIQLTAFTDTSHMTMSTVASAGAGTGTGTFYPCITTVAQAGEAAFIAGSAVAWVVGGMWLTATQAVVQGNQPVHAGDTVYIGPGIFREGAMTKPTTRNGSVGSPISWIGDPYGAQTGDAAGEVIISSAVSSNTASIPQFDSTNHGVLWELNTNATYHNLSNMTLLVSDDNQALRAQSSSNNISLVDMTIIAFGPAMGSPAVQLIGGNSVTPTQFLIDRCTIISMGIGNGLNLKFSGVIPGPTIDQGIIVRNSLIWAMGGTTSIYGCQIDGPAAGINYNSGGVTVQGCTIIGPVYGLRFNSFQSTPGSPQWAVQNCVLISDHPLDWSLNTGIFPLETNNLLLGISTTKSGNVTGSIGEGTIALLYPATSGRIGFAPTFDVGQWYKIMGQILPMLSPAIGSEMIGFNKHTAEGGPTLFESRGSQPPVGNGPGWIAHVPPALRGTLGSLSPGITTPFPKVDFLNRPRPAGQSSLPAVGYVERHDVVTKDTSIFNDSSSSVKITGPGDLEMLLPVDAATVTISVALFIGNSYTGGTLPQVVLLDAPDIGVVTQTVVAQGAFNAWQTVTLAPITPTAKGVVRLRLQSLDSAGTGQVNFDTIVVS